MSANIYNGGIIGAAASGFSGVWGVGDQGITYGSFDIDVEYLVVAGGGGGGQGSTGFANGAGGGAGGYRINTGETSGRNTSSESALTLQLFTDYTVTIGGGGTGSTAGATKGGDGTNSVFATITSTAGATT